MSSSLCSVGFLTRPPPSAPFYAVITVNEPEYNNCRSREHGNLEPTGEIPLLFKQNVHQTNLALTITVKYDTLVNTPVLSAGAVISGRGIFPHWFAVKSVTLAVTHKKSPLCNAGFSLLFINHRRGIRFLSAFPPVYRLNSD